ncbi:MAG: sigma-70 family RNA polymerase sigma factor [Erysipelotrichaceae bacterium]|nr:sigma-70 family RNA polymerase sigma factor [Erysipelotrichaceae bacterium]
MIPLTGNKDIRAWLFAIARNTLYSWYRRNNKTIPLSDFDVSSPEQSVIQMITDSQTAFSIHEILHAMPQPYKEVFTLRVFGELSFEQIGRLFGKSSGWARVVFFRAKNMIREQLEEKDDE